MKLESKEPRYTLSNYRLIGYLMAIAASLLFGFNGNLSKLLFDEGITPITLVEFRMIVGGLCLLFILLGWWRKGLYLPRRLWGLILIFGFSIAMVTYTYFVAISLLPIAVALVIQFSSAAWLTIGNAILHRRLPSAHVLVALALTLTGIMLITGLWQFRLTGMNGMGLLFAVLTLLATIAYMLLGQRVGQHMSSLTSTTYGALVAGVFWLCVQPPWTVPASTWTPHHLTLIILVGILGMAIPFALILGALQRIDAPRVSIVSMLELVAGGVIAYFWLGQRLDAWQLVGGLCVLVGIVVLQYEKPSIPA
jgi:drug/metabolite transporter (DMT)-like permease